MFVVDVKLFCSSNENSSLLKNLRQIFLTTLKHQHLHSGTGTASLFVMSDAIGDIAPAHLVQKTTDLEVMVKSDFECCMHA